MLGELLVSFYQREHAGASRWLEIWAYPDSTLNLVIASDSTEESEEHSFPCAPHHITNVLNGFDFQTSGPSGFVMLQRQGDALVAEFQRRTDERGWTQSIPVEDFRDSLMRSSRGFPYVL
jgi:hypothetical protein